MLAVKRGGKRDSGGKERWLGQRAAVVMAKGSDGAKGCAVVAMVMGSDGG